MKIMQSVKKVPGGLSHINHVRQLFSCTKKASTLAKGRRQV